MEGTGGVHLAVPGNAPLTQEKNTAIHTSCVQMQNVIRNIAMSRVVEWQGLQAVQCCP